MPHLTKASKTSGRFIGPAVLQLFKHPFPLPPLLWLWQSILAAPLSGRQPCHGQASSQLATPMMQHNTRRGIICERIGCSHYLITNQVTCLEREKENCTPPGFSQSQNSRYLCPAQETPGKKRVDTVPLPQLTNSFVFCWVSSCYCLLAMGENSLRGGEKNTKKSTPKTPTI